MAAPDISLQPPMDGLSSVSWSGDSSKLLVSSWDGSVQVHDTSALQSGPRPPSVYSTQAAILAATFSPQTSNGRTAYSGGLDKRLREWDFETGQNRVLGKADDALSTVTACGDSGVVVTGSWDAMLRVWDPRAATALVATHQLPSKVYCASFASASSSLVVSMAHRNVHVYDVRKLEEPKQKRESALKFMTRSVACMADGKGWASGSIEGRIAVEYFDAELESRKYAFRCHRQTIDGVDCVYPINALAYHPIHNTFASGGSDGTVSIWDHNAKKRMKQYPAFATEVSCLAFSPDGEKLAIGVSYEHDNGVSQPDLMGKTALLVKTTVMDDCRPKTKAA
ncbi:hypothetical protein NliqN6_0621 [Naganishia liquefaciens]|uniref:WD40 repeat domain-containing protein n=1 Tax=Naganishia liquefaciens TaxID=104408 RepID=A0A8H3YCF3_9TREE|nr:hypothetical protein NliqN6_0621 [Naganishia liquefaciens]